MSAAKSERVLFANQLRGLAALGVVVTHLMGVYFDQPTVSRITGTEPVNLTRPDWTAWLASPYHNLGPFSVAFFFLISGFVIPFSLQRLRQGGFLVARVFRIYPTYCACLALGLIALKSADPGPELDLNWTRIVTNSLLIHGYCGQPSLDWVNWTLAIEERFYLLVALLGVTLVRKPFLPMLAFSLVVLGYLHWFSTAAEKLIQTPPLFHVLNGFALDTHYLIYMLIGTLFYKHYRGNLGGAWLAVQSWILLAMFALAWSWSPSKPQFPTITYNYIYSFLLFALAYAMRDRWIAIRPLDWLAAISYPLYAVHTLVGFVFMQHLIRSGWSYYQTLLVTLPLLFTLCYVLHRTVEKPTQVYGKRLAAAARKAKSAKE